MLYEQNNKGVSKTPLLRIEVQEVPFFPIVADSTSITLTKSSKLLPSYYILWLICEFIFVKLRL